MGVLEKMSAASKPPVLGRSASKTREWVDSLIANAALLLLEGDDEPREVALARAAIGRFIELYAKQTQHSNVDRAQQLGASNEQVAFNLGLRPQTTSKRFPNRYQRKRAGIGSGGGAAGLSGWRKGDKSGAGKTADGRSGLSGARSSDAMAGTGASGLAGAGGGTGQRAAAVQP